MNFGCRATQSDGAALERQFAERGLERADSSARAQIVVLNTCTVTAAADQDARAAIRRIHRQNPDCRIVVTGCYAQRAAEEITNLPGVSQVIGNSHKHDLTEIALDSGLIRQNAIPGRVLARAAEQGVQNPVSGAEESSVFVPLQSLTNHPRQTPSDACLSVPDLREPKVQSPIFVSDIFAHTELLAAPVFDAGNERTRPNLKVQDGCDNRCSFCVIPFVRGQSRSLKLDAVVREVQQLVAAGYREVVISGINLGRWGRDLPVGNFASTNDELPKAEDRRLTTLIRAILQHTDLEKLRISSVEPMDWSDELIGLLATSPRIAKHAHVPMQSGSDRILRAMHRKYRPWHYREKIEKLRASIATAAIGADVMVGFPGETDADFEETRAMIDDLPFTYLHVFTYSARPGTPAANLPNQVPAQVARQRNRVLRDLASVKKLVFMKSFLGHTIAAITLNVFDGRYTECLTDNYLKLRLRGKHEANQWIQAKVTGVEAGALTSD